MTADPQDALTDYARELVCQLAATALGASLQPEPVTPAEDVPPSAPSLSPGWELRDGRVWHPTVGSMRRQGHWLGAGGADSQDKVGA
jgi:hypothetical protein